MRYLLFIFTLAYSALSLAQKDTPVIINTPIMVEDAPPPPGSASSIFKVVEHMPEFPGGEEAMMKFIQKNIQYPTMERENDIQGRVIVGFVVNEDGSISDIAVRKGVSSGLDKETVRVIKLFPKFKPGTQQGKPVRVQFMLPVMFKLAGGYSGPPPPPPVVNNDPHPMPVTSMPVPSPPPGVSKSEDEKNYTLPEFPGGIEALVKFINANNKYLRNSFGIKRYVTVWATIDEKGKVISPHVTSLTPKKDDDEALRIMKKLPKFKPATYKGKPQKWLYVIPVMFMD